MNLYDCGHEAEESEDVIVVSGGWCAPSEAVYDLDPPKNCPDCTTRMLMISLIGIDPGPKGLNLRIQRGGIQYRDKS